MICLSASAIFVIENSATLPCFTLWSWTSGPCLSQVQALSNPTFPQQENVPCLSAGAQGLDLALISQFM